MCPTRRTPCDRIQSTAAVVDQRVPDSDPTYLQTHHSLYILRPKKGSVSAYLVFTGRRNEVNDTGEQRKKTKKNSASDLYDGLSDLQHVPPVKNGRALNSILVHETPVQATHVFDANPP